MIKILFFAQIRELVGIDQLQFELGDIRSAEALRAHLAERGGKWSLALEPGRLLVAINQSIAPMASELHDGDEVAFFPPVTGG